MSDEMNVEESDFGKMLDATFKPVHNGEVVEGTVIDVKPDQIILNIGAKADGILTRNEYSNDNSVDLTTVVKVGDKMEVKIIKVNDGEGQILLTYKRLAAEKGNKRLEEAYENGEVLKAKVVRVMNGGLSVNVEGARVFIPASLVSDTYERDLNKYMDQEIEFKVIEFNPRKRRIIGDRKQLVVAEKKQAQEELFSRIHVGDAVEGVVKNITDFGAFIDLGGIDGLLHITDMSWGRISHPNEMLELGQEIEVMILDIDYEKERVSLGLKQKSKNPWDEVENKYPVGATVKGRIVNIMPYGAFVEIEEGVEGLIHVSEMSWTKRVTKAGDIVSLGEEVEAVVLDIDKEGKKISLGLRQKTRNPWEVLAEKYPAGSRIKGKVRNMTSYGAFVEIENDIDGMIHVSDMSWTRKINNPNEILKVDDEVEAVILDIDPQQQRISLGLKQIEEDPWANIGDLYKIGDIVKGKVTKITQFGAFVELTHKIDGLVHISQISKDRVEKVKDKLALGQEIEARVIKIDREERRIGLSIKALDESFSEADLKAASEEVSAALKPGEALGDMGQLIGDSLDSLDVVRENKKD